MSFLQDMQNKHKVEAKIIDWWGEPCTDKSKILKSMLAEYFDLPSEVQEKAQVGKRCYIHTSRNLDYVLETPSDGIIGTIKEILPSGLIVKIAAHIANNNLIRWDIIDQRDVFKSRGVFESRHVFLTFKGVKGAMRGYIHCADTSQVNSGLVYIGSMSSIVAS